MHDQNVDRDPRGPAGGPISLRRVRSGDAERPGLGADQADPAATDAGAAPVPVVCCAYEGCERPRYGRNKLCQLHRNRFVRGRGMDVGRSSDVAPQRPGIVHVDVPDLSPADRFRCSALSVTLAAGACAARHERSARDLAMARRSSNALIRGEGQLATAACATCSFGAALARRFDR